MILYQLLNLTGIAAVYSIPTSGSEPNIKCGSIVVATNMITPKRGDFVTYTFSDPNYGSFIYTHRLCGMENDTIEIIDGTLFVNGENFDANYNLKHGYILNEEKFSMLDRTVTGSDYRVIPTNNGKNFFVFIEDADAKKLQLEKYRFLIPKGESDPKIEDTYQNQWNTDHFGPLVIPKGKVFLLGDNRDNSQDSRFFGLIDEAAITGVLWKTLFTIGCN